MPLQAKPLCVSLLLGVLLGVLLGTVAGCGGPAAGGPAAEKREAAAGVPVDRLEVREPRATLTPDAGAVYLTVVNPGPREDRLLRVETAAARGAQIHETIEDNGVMRMVAHPEGLAVPAAGRLELQPGGKHIMLIGPHVPAGLGGTMGLTLHFEHAGAIEVQAVLAGMGGMDPGGHTMDHGSMDHEGMDHEGMDHGESAGKPGGGG